jgi:hypothetical protein
MSTGGVVGPWASKIRSVDIEVRTQVSTGAATYPLDVIALQNGATVLLVAYDAIGAPTVATLGQFGSVTFPLPATIRIAKGGTIPFQIP